MSAPVPAYPVVYVDVALDGSAHVNVAGRHEHFHPAPSDVTRHAITAYATAVAAELHRPLRMQITDPEGKWLVAVHPNGTVTDLADPAEKARRPRKQAVTVPATATTAGRVPITTPAPAVPSAQAARPIAPPPTPVDPDLEHTHLAQRPTPKRSAAPTATLRFSTGDVARVTGAALIGRRPATDDGENVDLLVSVDDESRMLSRTHLRIEWHDGALWATDRASSNGTTIERDDAAPLELTPWQPLQLHDQDVAVLGDVRLTVSLVDEGQEANLE